MSTDTTKGIATARWRLDPVRSRAEFRVPNLWGLGNVKGTFDRLHGWLEIGDDGRRRLELTIEADSLNTGNDKRDDHLKSADFFDTQRHPDVRFVSTAVSDPVHGRFQVEGELLAAGNRVRLTLEPTMSQTSEELEIDASATVDQRELGMTASPLGMIRTPTTLTVHAHLRPER
jgi:polyisoprenoid-binding protein YceI